MTAWDVLKWVGGTVLCLGAFTAWWFREFLKAYLPWLDPLRAGRRAQQRDLPLPEGERFVVLIADLQGDDGQKSHTRHVAAALEAYRGLDVPRIGPGPEWDIGARDEFEAAARKLLADRRGDVLILGDVAAKDKGLRLRFLSADADLRPELPAAEGSRPGEYVLTETGLPLDFDRDFNTVIVALVLVSVAPATDRQGHYLVNVLEPVAGRLKCICDHMPAGLADDQCGVIWHSLALASTILGEQTGSIRWFAEAVQAYESALKVIAREDTPVRWARIQVDFGSALAILGERDGKTARLEQAIAAYRSATEVLTRDQAPLLWAATQNNLGNALKLFGEREFSVGLLDEAVRAYWAALEVWTRERMPLRWALAQNNLGDALSSLGEQRAETTYLKKAVEAFQEALQVRTRESVPLDWAATKNNLGVAYQRWDKLEQGSARLHGAIAAYRAALEVYTRDQLQLDWAMVQNNLGTALEAMGEREDGTARLEEAVAAFRAALEVFRTTDAPYYAGIAERNLARAEALLADRRGGAAAE